MIDRLVNKQAGQAVAEQEGPGEQSLLIFRMWHLHPSYLIIIAVLRGVDGADYLSDLKMLENKDEVFSLLQPWSAGKHLSVEMEDGFRVFMLSVLLYICMYFLEH